jgi:hypothetical protein
MDYIRDSLLPVLNKLIVDPSSEVRALSSEALVRIAHLMDDEEIGRLILTLVLCLAHDESDEQRTTAVSVHRITSLVLSPLSHHSCFARSSPPTCRLYVLLFDGLSNCVYSMHVPHRFCMSWLLCSVKS